MATMLEALKKARLVPEARAQELEKRKEAELRRMERASDDLVIVRAYGDLEAQRKDERFHRQAAKEGTKSASRVGSKAYYDRFKK